MRRATYKHMQSTLTNLLGDLNILAGNDVPAQGASMRDVIGTAKTNAASLAAQLEACYQGLTESFMVYPDPEECLRASDGGRTEECCDRFAREGYHHVECEQWDGHNG